MGSKQCCTGFCQLHRRNGLGEGIPPLLAEIASNLWGKVEED